jgi:hypothetical protein
MHVTPPHPFGLQYAPHLAASDGDAVFSGGGGEGIQRPVVGFLVLIPSFRLAASAAEQPPGRIGSYPSETIQERRSVCVRAWACVRHPGDQQARLSPRRSEAVDTFAHGLSEDGIPAGQRFLRGAKSAPAEHDHPGARYPVCGSMTAVGQLTRTFCSSSVS